jgi:hypothetical protein
MLGQLPPGFNEAFKTLKPISNIIITNDDVSFLDFELDTWSGKITNDEMWLPDGLYSYDNQTPEPATEQNVFGQTLISEISPSFITFYLDSNPLDFTNIVNSLKGDLYRILFILEDGNIIGQFTNGVFKGFNCRIQSADKLPDVSTIENDYKIFVSLENWQELNNKQIINVYWTSQDLIDYMRTGVRIYPRSEWVGRTTYTVQVFTCNIEITTLDKNDFEIIDYITSNSIKPIIHSVTYANGVYTFNIGDIEGTDIFSDGDQFTYIVNTDTYVSNPVKVIRNENWILSPGFWQSNGVWTEGDIWD